MTAPEFNVWVGGAWYGPSYPEAGSPPGPDSSEAAGPEPVVSAGEAPVVAAEPPPKSGAGSSRAKWAEHASSLDVTFSDDDTRDDIIDAVAAAGHRTD